MDKNNILEIYNKFEILRKTYRDCIWSDFENTLESIKADVKADKNNQIEERIDDYYTFLDFIENLKNISKSLEKLNTKDFYTDKKPEFEKLLNSFFPNTYNPDTYTYNEIVMLPKHNFIEQEPYIAFYHKYIDTYETLYTSYKFIWKLYSENKDTPLITKEQWEKFERFFIETSNYIFEECWSSNKECKEKWNIILIKSKQNEEFVLDEISKQLVFLEEIINRENELMEKLKTDKKYYWFTFVKNLSYMFNDIKQRIIEKKTERKYHSSKHVGWF